MDTQTTSPAGQAAIDPGPGVLTPGAAGVQTEGQGPPESPTAVEPPPAQPRPPGFRERGRMRRRARFLRKARELAYRDLGGLVFEMQRLGHRNDELVAAKLNVLANFDGELRALEAALGDRHPVTVLHEAGIAACPRCAAIHGNDDRFCPVCGMPIGRHADRPIVATPAMAGAAAPAGTGTVPPGLAPPPPGAPGPIAPGPTVSPAQLALGAPAPAHTSPSQAGAAPAVGAAQASSAATALAAASRPAVPTPADEDMPTEIIRPQDDTK